MLGDPETLPFGARFRCELYEAWGCGVEAAEIRLFTQTWSGKHSVGVGGVFRLDACRTINRSIGCLSDRPKHALPKYGGWVSRKTAAVCGRCRETIRKLQRWICLVSGSMLESGSVVPGTSTSHVTLGMMPSNAAASCTRAERQKTKHMVMK